MMPNATPNLFFTTQTISPLFICLHWLPSCFNSSLQTPHPPLEDQTQTPCSHFCSHFLFLPSGPPTANFAPAAFLLLFPSCFSCIASAALYTTDIPFLHGFLQRFFTLSLPFLSLISCWICLLPFGVNGREIVDL